jgi:UDP-N-acetylmuramyl pentapeptide phosphotransferase/UDP-N-acetylglucosamine-1-phosphate transferase
MFKLSLLLIFSLLNFFIVRNINFFSKKINILDIPDKNRKLHSKPIFLGGGVLLYFNYILAVIINSYFVANEFAFYPRQILKCIKKMIIFPFIKHYNSGFF